MNSQPLVASPVAQREVWNVPLESMYNGGVLSTGGNLVVQGTAGGDLVVYRADTGEELVRLAVGTGIMAAPMTYEVDGDQYIAVLAGYGGGRGTAYPEGSAPYEYVNYGRLLAFKLDGGEVPLPPRRQPVATPEPPELPASERTIAEGAELFATHCGYCHGGNGEAVLSAYPDLRRMTEGWATGLQRQFDLGFAPAAQGALRLEDDGETSPALRVLGRFFNENDFTTMVLSRIPQEQAAARLIVGGATVRNVRRLDPTTGRTRRVRSTRVDGGYALSLHAGSDPVVTLFRKQAATPGVDLAEDLEVGTRRELTASEIIARFQLLQREQDDRLERWTARGRIDFHFRLAQGGAGVDVSIESRYFWERGGQLEWEQRSYFINGNKVRWKNIPQLPLIQPEKVVTLPLDLTLDKTYSYRLRGRDRVAGREAYVLEFAPNEPDPPPSPVVSDKCETSKRP